MWVFTPRGFYSVVEKPQDRGSGTLTIRTRNRADIVALKDLFPDAKPYRVRHSDYAWRIRVSREQWAAALVTMTDEVRYSNFKDEVTRKQGRQRHDVYLRVWSALLSLRDPAPRSRRKTRAAGTRDFSDEGAMVRGFDYGHLSTAEQQRMLDRFPWDES